MPYIKPELRPPINEHLDKLFPLLTCAGDFNYAITVLIHKYLDQELNYARINEMVGMLECCKLELYRRLAFYEDSKIETNGDIGVLKHVPKL